MPRKLTGREKELEILAHRIGEILRKEGVWAVPDSIVEKKDQKIGITMTIFPLKWIEKHDGHVPTRTILRIGQAYKFHEIPEIELKNIPFIEKK